MEIESLLSTVEQDPIAAVNNALIPSMNALVSAEILRNPDSDVRVFVVSCLTEIMRITDQMKENFEVTVGAFEKLQDATSRSYRKAEAVLDTVSKVRSSLVMLDLECDDLILEMFRQFLKIIRDAGNITMAIDAYEECLKIISRFSQCWPVCMMEYSSMGKVLTSTIAMHGIAIEYETVNFHPDNISQRVICAIS